MHFAFYFGVRYSVFLVRYSHLDLQVIRYKKVKTGYSSVHEWSVIHNTT